jgi:hypothetical protein
MTPTEDADVLALAREAHQMADVIRNDRPGAAEVLDDCARALSRPVPEGFVLVPKAATTEQIKAGDDWLLGRDLPGDWRAVTLAAIYAAMIAAAPAQRED